MIERYSLTEMTELFTEESKFQNWLKVELSVVDAMASLEEIPKKDVELIKKNLPNIDSEFVKKVQEREKVTQHDTAAFVDIVQSSVGQPQGRWIHFGLTSSDVVDTALSLTLVNACKLLKSALQNLLNSLKNKAVEHQDTLTIGRTHGQHAEPMTFGVKLALWAHQVARDLKRLEFCQNEIAVGKLSGAVGTYSNIDPKIEKIALSQLGLRPEPSTQVISRDHHASYIYACASICATIETIALEVRHLSRTEVGEISEAFLPGQKGSSAMPHKQNPVLSERLCGLSRIVRAYLIPAFENIALWHERDISHSSVERMMFPDVSSVTYYLCVMADRLINTMKVNKDKMLENLEETQGSFFSQKLLLELVKKGISRDDAYQLVQSISQLALKAKQSLQETALNSVELANYFTSQELNQIFSLSSLVANCNIIIESAKNI
jgi:adenylosuccinate lyase